MKVRLFRPVKGRESLTGWDGGTPNSITNGGGKMESCHTFHPTLDSIKITAKMHGLPAIAAPPGARAGRREETTTKTVR